jgi:hypothetical protein
MDDRGTYFGCRPGNGSRASLIYPEGKLGLRFSAIHRGIGCGRYDHIGLDTLDGTPYRSRVQQIQFRSSNGNNLDVVRLATAFLQTHGNLAESPRDHQS